MVLYLRATETNFVHPLVILEILSRSEAFMVGDVQQYILKWLNEQIKMVFFY